MISDAELAHAADLIRAGKLVAFPTETVYGLGANALDAAAVDRIFVAKNRPPTSPLIVHVATLEMVHTVVAEWPAAAEALAQRFWPGSLTLVLPKRDVVPERVTAGLDTVGVRMPAHPVALRLIRAARVPIAAPSANRFTQLSPTTAEHVRRGLGDSVDMVLDGGPTTIGIESTVLSLAAEGGPVLLRPGVVTREQIEEVIGPVRLPQSIEGPHPAPGMHHRHYSPRTRLLITHEPPAGAGAYVWHTVAAAAEKSVQLPRDAAAYAARLYAVLHSLDVEGWEFIAVEPVPEDAEWDGVRDRLRRAANS